MLRLRAQTASCLFLMFQFMYKYHIRFDQYIQISYDLKFVKRYMVVTDDSLLFLPKTWHFNAAFAVKRYIMVIGFQSTMREEDYIDFILEYY